MPPLRLLADENFPGPLVRALREQGHDVISVKETMRGASDREILAVAQSQDRLLLTFDKDFGELAYRARLPASSGVILFRLNGPDPGTDNARALAALGSRDDWSGHFVVIEDDRVRIRPLAFHVSPPQEGLGPGS